MRFILVTVGRVREPYLLTGLAEYEKRLSRYAQVEWIHVPEEPLPRRERQAEEAAVLAREGERLLRALERLPAASHVVALDVAGRPFSSEELAAYLESLAAGGTSTVAWVVGGTLGLDPRVKDRADLRLSLSRLTFPHQLVPLLLLEQFYRAFRIIRGEPYHH